MLHAINRKKARLDVFRAAGQRVPLEDIVTSTVFGTLSLLRAEDQQEALTLLFTSMGATLPSWLGAPHILLWPKRQLIARGLRERYVEPDVEIVDGSGASLIIEVKWGARLGLHELSAQWLSLSPAARTASRHILLVLEPAAYRREVEKERVTVRERTRQAWPFQLCSWRDVADACRQLAAHVGLEQSIRHWAQQVQIFLLREDPKTLGGWSNLELVPVSPIEWRFGQGWFGELSSVGEVTWEFKKDE
jgi:hypothetical protein